MEHLFFMPAVRRRGHLYQVQVIITFFAVELEQWFAAFKHGL